MRDARRFLQLDVFCDRPGAGNPLAVVLDSDGIDTAGMQDFARWTNLSETIFLLPPTAPGANYRLRIFTPRSELPFAGHPAVGSAHAVLEAGLATATDGHLTLQCAAGLLPVRVEGADKQRRHFVRAPRGKPGYWQRNDGLIDAALAGLPRGRLPVALIDNGPRWLLAELADEAAVRGMQPDLDAIAALTVQAGAVGVAVFARSDAADAQLAVRAYCPADGIPEDPVTGSANAGIAAWLWQNHALPARRYVASQGREIGRDGRIEVEVDAVDEVWIGGQTQTVVRGELAW
jgi:PhzF family phenazine biosynthesis protein